MSREPSSGQEKTMDKPNSGGATSADITSILGPMDSDRLLQILSPHPTVTEVEQAAMWLSSDADVFGANPPIKGTVSSMVTILTAEEEEEQR
jgi:hypothetical protein